MVDANSIELWRQRKPTWMKLCAKNKGLKNQQHPFNLRRAQGTQHKTTTYARVFVCGNTQIKSDARINAANALWVCVQPINTAKARTAIRVHAQKHTHKHDPQRKDNASVSRDDSRRIYAERQSRGTKKSHHCCCRLTHWWCPSLWAFYAGWKVSPSATSQVCPTCIGTDVLFNVYLYHCALARYAHSY